MFPNPQAALPLPPSPNLEQYRKLAKDLVSACRSGAPEDIGAWCRQWLDALRRSQPRLSDLDGEMIRRVDGLEDFARRTLAGDGCALTRAQFVIARSHGFPSWPKFIRHLEGLAASAFEQAADAIVTGDAPTLRRLLGAEPRLALARSDREHRATLLHYVSANGVEGYRQLSPPNAPEIARMLLDAGADIEATAAVYSGACTTLLLVATSTPPKNAGVQIPLLELLLERGARVDRLTAGRSIVRDALANGCPEAAEFLAHRGAPMSLESASALGHVAEVRRLLDAGTFTQDELQQAFLWACGYGQDAVVELLLQRGAQIATPDEDGQTGLHWAAIGGNPSTVRLLVARKAPLEGRNKYGGTVLGQALWSAGHGGDADDYEEIVKTLIDAGAQLRDRHVPVNDRIDALLLRYGSRPEPTWAWYGEEPGAR